MPLVDGEGVPQIVDQFVDYNRTYRWQTCLGLVQL